MARQPRSKKSQATVAIETLPPQQRSINIPEIPLGAAYMLLTMGHQTTSGMSISKDAVLGIPTVRRCILAIANTVAGMPCLVYKNQRDGSRIEDADHFAYWMLKRSPSPAYSSFIYFQTVISDLLVDGNSYSEIKREIDGGREGEPLELVRLNPAKCKPVEKKGQLLYEYNPQGIKSYILPENIIHLKNLGDGFVGYSVLDQLAETFGVSLALRKYLGVYFRNNAKPGGWIEQPTYFKDNEQLVKFKEGWANQHKGLDNAHEVGVLCGGAKWHADQPDNEAAQYTESRLHEDLEIARLMGVPPHMVGLPISGMSYNSLEQENKAFLLHTVNPILRMVEQELETKLLRTSQLIRDSHFIEFKTSDYDEPAPDTLSTIRTNYLNSGIYTLNQVLTEMRQPTIGEEGDRRRMPSNITFIDTIPTAEEKAQQSMAPVIDDGQPKAQPMPSDPDLTQDDTVDDELPARYRKLLEHDVARLTTRIRKAVEAAALKDGFTAWLDEGLASHRSVMVESLHPANPNAAKIVDDYLDELKQELQAVTREQVPVVMARRRNNLMEKVYADPT
jgi:HK97 family phage portal protein